MIMCTLLSMVYGSFKPCFTHITSMCFKETVLVFNVHLSCFVDFILCPTDKYMFKVNNKKNWINMHVFKFENKCSMSLFFCFCCWLWPKPAYQYSFSTFYFEQVFVSRVWTTVVWTGCSDTSMSTHISFRNLSLHPTETNYDLIKCLLWYEHVIVICFSSKSTLGIPSE